MYEQDQNMYNYIVVDLKYFNLQMQYMFNMLHEINLLHLNKLHDWNQTMIQNFKLQMQRQAVLVSDLSIFKVTY